MTFHPSPSRSRPTNTDGPWWHTGSLKLALLDVYGDVALPDGSVTTDMLAPNAVTELLGSYQQAVSYTLPNSNVWAETPVSVTVTTTGAQLRFTFAMMLECPTKGQRIYWDVMLDGALEFGAALGGFDAPENTYATMASGTYYAQTPPPAGLHRVSVALYGPAGAVIDNSIWATLYVVEERR